ncbi:hypothetical protein QBC39DRAFT_48696 [Podospora conica]|nr:hypothetical protein QBC39DRAFT_48696 [Schizothecium conicum]
MTCPVPGGKMELVRSEPRVQQRRRLSHSFCVLLFLKFGSARAAGRLVCDFFGKQAGQGRTSGQGQGQGQGKGLWANLPLARRQRTGRARLGLAWLGLPLSVLYGGILFGCNCSDCIK